METPELKPRKPKHHDKKCHPQPFAAVRAGKKTFEIRVEDGIDDYREGDTITLHEWAEPEFKAPALSNGYSGETEGPFNVGTVIPGGRWGLPENVCVFAILRPAPSRPSVEGLEPSAWRLPEGGKLVLNQRIVFDEAKRNSDLFTDYNIPLYTGDQVASLLASSQPREWQPMEAAPRDGTRFLIAVDVCGLGERKVWDTVANENEHQGFEGIEPDDILLGWMHSPTPPPSSHGEEP